MNPCVLCGVKTDEEVCKGCASTLREINRKGYRPVGPCQPTKAEPGTEAKIRVLEKRLSKRQELWHPADPVLPTLKRTVSIDANTLLKIVSFQELVAKLLPTFGDDDPL